MTRSILLAALLALALTACGEKAAEAPAAEAAPAAPAAEAAPAEAAK
jgi:predicted small lipoprotein YifL